MHPRFALFTVSCTMAIPSARKHTSTLFSRVCLFFEYIRSPPPLSHCLAVWRGSPSAYLYTHTEKEGKNESKPFRGVAYTHIYIYIFIRVCMYMRWYANCRIRMYRLTIRMLALALACGCRSLSIFKNVSLSAWFYRDERARLHSFFFGVCIRESYTIGWLCNRRNSSSVV